MKVSLPFPHPLFHSLPCCIEYLWNTILAMKFSGISEICRVWIHHYTFSFTLSSFPLVPSPKNLLNPILSLDTKFSSVFQGFVKFKGNEGVTIRIDISVKSNSFPWHEFLRSLKTWECHYLPPSSSQFCSSPRRQGLGGGKKGVRNCKELEGRVVKIICAG